MSSAVVFAYHNVGVRSLSVLLAHGVKVSLVVTHEDQANETIWFNSVRQLALDEDIPVITPPDPNQPEILAQIAALAPDFIFSFYYRHMLSPDLLNLAGRGCYNMHGSLLPKYRGRVPVNWAIIHGETQSGATLHVMTAKPDQGAIVGQKSVPILPNDTAFEVMQKVAVAAELCLDEVIVHLLQGKATHRPQALSEGSYFSGRKPEDGRINWQQNARQIHNLVRAVAPPYPGAFFDSHGQRVMVLHTRVTDEVNPERAGQMWCDEAGKIRAAASDGSILRILTAEINGQLLGHSNWRLFFPTSVITLRTT